MRFSVYLVNLVCSALIATINTPSDHPLSKPIWCGLLLLAMTMFGVYNAVNKLHEIDENNDLGDAGQIRLLAEIRDKL